MANPDYKLCDVCGGKVHVASIFAATGREQDASGNGYDTVGEYFDLCPLHMRLAVVNLLKSAANPRVEDYEAGKRLIECVRRNATHWKDK